jgi:hypothetical protein
MAQAGFADDFDALAMEGFVRFGTAARAQKFEGDQFDRLEVERDRDVAAHAARLAKTRWLIKDRPIEVPEREDFAKKGLFVNCAVPLRLGVAKGDQWSTSGHGFRIFPNWADPLDVWFLAKGNRLVRCNPLQVEEVQRSGGELYYAEVPTTSLILNLRLDLATAKAIARQSHSYSVDLVLYNLRYIRAAQWGYFREGSLRSRDWDCAGIMRSYDVGLGTGPVPNYFVVEQRPWLARAELQSAVLKDHRGNSIASFQRK